MSAQQIPLTVHVKANGEQVTAGEVMHFNPADIGVLETKTHPTIAAAVTIVNVKGSYHGRRGQFWVADTATEILNLTNAVVTSTP